MRAALLALCTVPPMMLGLFFSAAPEPAGADAPDPAILPGTRPLAGSDDLALAMVAGIDRFLQRETEASIGRRAEHWKRDFSSPEAYRRSVAPNRERLRRILGAVDDRLPPPAADDPYFRPAAPAAEGENWVAYRVRWPVLPGVEFEGLELRPRSAPPRAAIVALPDCDWTPEALAGLESPARAQRAPAPQPFARRLAESGCRVLVPTLIDRDDTWSGHPAVRMTNQPHREFLYRAAFEMGRHVIGYELLKVFSAVDLLAAAAPGVPIGAIGYGEGGLLAFYAAALDERIAAAVVSGYFGPREALWQEPIYRNVFGLLEAFGDAEIATLVAPRALIVEHCRFPEVAGPPPAREGRSGAAPGAIVTPPLEAVRAEAERARALLAGSSPTPVLEVIPSPTDLPGSEPVLSRFLRALGVRGGLAPAGPPPKGIGPAFDPRERQRRQFEQLLEQTQRQMREGEFLRAAFWSRADASSVERWRESTRSYRDYLWDEVIGRFPPADLPANPRSRLVYDEPTHRGYEVVLDVWRDVFAYGILLVPKDLRPGERRPVVVCQHGLEGRPQNVADARVDHPSYHAFAAQLAARGFVTFAPQNPYIGGDRFRVLQRKANPLKRSLFSVIVRQHERILEWLASLPFVDPERIAFYGLSYGGKTAMRVPALLEGYCLSICSADYNEWIWKNVSSRHRYSYLFTGEYEMPEFDLGSTFNYAEMSWLICPRPFMVERGHDDGVAPDEWVAYEYAKTRRLYDRLGLGDRTEIEFFNGPHTIHGVGTFAFPPRPRLFPPRP